MSEIGPGSVVIARMQHEDDIIGIFVSSNTNNVVLKTPHFINSNYLKGQIIIWPYCIYSDHEDYVFDRSNLKFVVPASSIITSKYLDIINTDNELINDEFKMLSELSTKH